MDVFSNTRIQLFGEAAALLCSLPSHRNRYMGSLVDVYWPAFQHDRLRLFTDATGASYGFIAWADVSNRCHQRLTSTGAMTLHLSEWNEGHNRWIVDAGWHTKMATPFADSCRNLFKDCDILYYAKAYEKRNVVRSLRVDQARAIINRQYQMRHFRPAPVLESGHMLGTR